MHVAGNALNENGNEKRQERSIAVVDFSSFWGRTEEKVTTQERKKKNGEKERQRCVRCSHLITVGV